MPELRITLLKFCFHNSLQRRVFKTIFRSQSVSNRPQRARKRRPVGLLVGVEVGLDGGAVVGEGEGEHEQDAGFLWI